jgi:hypothetical protein
MKRSWHCENNNKITFTQKSEAARRLMKIQVLWDMTLTTNPLEWSCEHGYRHAGPMKGEETGIGRLATKPQREKPRTPFEFRRNKTNLQRRILILRLCKFFNLLNININYEAYATSLISSCINSITGYAMLQLTSQKLSRSFFRELLVLTRKINLNTLINRARVAQSV